MLCLITLSLLHEPQPSAYNLRHQAPPISYNASAATRIRHHALPDHAVSATRASALRMQLAASNTTYQLRATSCDHQLPPISYNPSATTHQPPPISYHPSAITPISYYSHPPSCLAWSCGCCSTSYQPSALGLQHQRPPISYH
ncbi:hypothetical protein BKA56DRAFT_733975 [Ilyonectria sp. MPI-CAGE-AT-0026]|nr:hypothetical protein BKA56DRAFT_733975 [Ilyonectria sp. MPI-CAGE-AT-0026]